MAARHESDIDERSAFNIRGIALESELHNGPKDRSVLASRKPNTGNPRISRDGN